MRVSALGRTPADSVTASIPTHRARGFETASPVRDNYVRYGAAHPAGSGAGVGGVTVALIFSIAATYVPVG